MRTCPRCGTEFNIGVCPTCYDIGPGTVPPAPKPPPGSPSQGGPSR